MRKISNFEQILGIHFTQKKILEQALTHRSYLNEADVDHPSNERLEFLGDAILSFLISEYLFQKYPNYPEGKLTNLRSAIVRTETLAEAAKKIKLGNHLLLSRGEEESGGRKNPSLLADGFEAIIGAIFIDQGIRGVKMFLYKYLIKNIPKIIASRAHQDLKSLFQEKVQEVMRLSPVYKVLKEEGLDHAKTFHVGVFVNDKLYGKGVGKSKQKAEKRAAAVALERWEKKR